jgi:hypothetical protein
MCQEIKSRRSSEKEMDRRKCWDMLRQKDAKRRACQANQMSREKNCDVETKRCQVTLCWLRPVIGSKLRGLNNYPVTTPDQDVTSWLWNSSQLLRAIYINLSKDPLFPPSPGARFRYCGF